MVNGVDERSDEMIRLVWAACKDKKTQIIISTTMVQKNISASQHTKHWAGTGIWGYNEHRLIYTGQMKIRKNTTWSAQLSRFSECISIG